MVSFLSRTLTVEYSAVVPMPWIKQADHNYLPKKPCSCARYMLAPPARPDYRNQAIPHDVRLPPLKLKDIHAVLATSRQLLNDPRVRNDRGLGFFVEKHPSICLNHGPNQQVAHRQDDRRLVQSHQLDNQPWIGALHKSHIHDR